MSLQVDRKVLESQYSRNNLNIHFKLVSLYVTNLNSLATTSALIAGLSFGCIHEFDYPTKFIPTAWRFGYFYSLFSMLALVFAILALSQTTICVIFGPTMFLFGENHSDSLSALQIMKHQQKEGFFWSCSCVAMAFLQTLFFEWGVTHFPLACILTVVHFCGYYIIYNQGLKTIGELTPPPQQSQQADSKPNVAVMTGQGHHPTFKDLLKSSLAGLSHGGQGSSGDPDHPPTLESAPSPASNFSQPEDIKNHILQIRRRGYLWTKNANRSYQSDHFVRVYVVLESGELTFYREREDFIESNQAITESPLPLRHYALTTSKRIITQYTHPPPIFGAAGMRQLLTGSHELTAADFMNAKFDVPTALASFKFSLIPTSENELLTLVPLHFLAESESDFTEWVDPLTEIESLYRTLSHMGGHANNIRLHQDAQASLKYANSVDRLPSGMLV